MQVEIPLIPIQVIVGAIAALLVTRWFLRKISIGEYQTRHVVITGCDSGFGKLATYRFEKLGFYVFAGCLTEEGVNALRDTCSDRVFAFRLDVTNRESIGNGLSLVESKLPKGKGLWGLVNNAGVVTPIVCIEMQHNEQFERCMAVNLYGVINVTKAFLPLIRQRRGRIVNVASCAGRLAGAYTAPYCISKHGVEAFSDSLRRELYKTGVTVHIIEPGMFLTPIFDLDKARSVTRKAIAEADKEVLAYYGEKEAKQVMEMFTSSAVVKFASTNLEKVPDAFIHALTARYPKYRYVVGWDANTFVRLLWNLPESISDYILSAASPVPAGAKDE